MVLMGENEVYLPERLYLIVEAICKEKRRLDARELSALIGKKQEDIMRDLAELESKGLIRISSKTIYLLRLSELGLKYLEVGLPEERIINVLRENGGKVSLKALMRESAMTPKEFSAALGRLRKARVVTISSREVVLNECELTAFEESIRRMKDAMKKLREPVQAGSIDEFRELKYRGIIEITPIKKVFVEPAPSLLDLCSRGLIKRAKVVTRLTSDLIISGKWREVKLKEFDLKIDVPLRKVRKPHPYLEFLDRVREIIVGMGFKEVKGPHVETALWNFDVLFVPQYHPSRRDSDVYYVENTVNVTEDLKIISRVKEIHEKRLMYRWDPRQALTLVLRTHTTPVSVKTIWKEGKGEYRAFSLDRVFRPDTPDATHLMEFHQLEGIIVSKKVTFRDLLGVFKELADALGLGEVRFRPAYFPFTEPSVEGYIRHPSLGWIEVFPGGMFRREVLKPLGLPDDYKVAAWGIGIDRIAMMVLGKDDIRDLYTNDIEVINSTHLGKVVIQ
jgi:phenylalanyl-tRNA synthetase alpha chain